MDSEHRTWIDRVRVSPRYPPLFPNLDEKKFRFNEAVIERALKSNSGFNAKYLDKPWQFYYPVNIVRREWVSYVVCTTEKAQNQFQEFALHRFQFPDVVDPNALELKPSPDWLELNPNRQMLLGNVEGNWGELSMLKIRISGPPAQHLSEVRFHFSDRDSNKTKIISKHPDDGSRIREVVLEIRDIHYDYTFKCWLLGLGAYCVILAYQSEDKDVNPIADIKKELQEMVRLYGVD